MHLELDGVWYTGRAVDLRGVSVDRDALVAAIRDDPSSYDVDCPPPGPVHERAGVLVPAMGLKVRTALAAAARTRGIETPHDESIDRLASDLAALSETIEDAERSPADGPPPEDIARLRERTAELRGQVTALESTGSDPTDARATLRETAARLSELETRRIAAEQTHQRLRELRDRRERRLRLEDELANVRRDARATLVADVRDEYATAVDEIHADTASDPFAVQAQVAALAVLHVAEIRAPVVVAALPAIASGRIDDPASLADWLDGPVVRL